MATLQEDAEKYREAVLDLGRAIADAWRLRVILAWLDRQIRRFSA